MECIQFNSSEERVVAGSQSGSLRLWDLEAAKSKWFVLQLLHFGEHKIYNKKPGDSLETSKENVELMLTRRRKLGSHFIL